MSLFDFLKKKEKKEEAPACCCNTEVKEPEAPACCCGAEPQEETPSCCCSAEPQETTEDCGCGCSCETTTADVPCCEGAADGICCIKVLGSGCKNCHLLFENTKAAVSNLGLNIEVEYITDMEKVMSYGVMSMPGLVVNDKVVAMGKVLKAADVEKLIKSM